MCCIFVDIIQFTHNFNPFPSYPLVLSKPHPPPPSYKLFHKFIINIFSSSACILFWRALGHWQLSSILLCSGRCEQGHATCMCSLTLSSPLLTFLGLPLRIPLKGLSSDTPWSFFRVCPIQVHLPFIICLGAGSCSVFFQRHSLLMRFGQ